MKNILMVGNGFDIYHQLPTRYIDFIFLSKEWNCFIDKYNASNQIAIEKEDTQYSVKLTNDNKLCKESFDDYVNNKVSFNQSNIDFLDKHISNNIWIKYFVEKIYKDINWIDVEKEIENVLEQIHNYYLFLINDYDGQGAPEDILDKKIVEIMSYFNKKELEITGYGGSKYGDPDFMTSIINERENHVISYLDSELIIFNECFRIFIKEFISRLKIKVYSDQINNIEEPFIINFNYTNTLDNISIYEQYYDIHQIHGFYNEKDGIVLGISDDLLDDSEEFIRFKKYYQRIQKKTGSKYKQFMNDDDNSTYHYGTNKMSVYCMGMSFDYTDKTVIKDVLSNDNVIDINIYYHDDRAKDSIIYNLVTIFGREWVIEKSGDGTIKFINLEPGIDISE